MSELLSSHVHRSELPVEEPVAGIVGLEPNHNPRSLPDLDSVHGDGVNKILGLLMALGIELAAPEKTAHEIGMRWVANCNIFARTGTNLEPVGANKAIPKN